MKRTGIGTSRTDSKNTASFKRTNAIVGCSRNWTQPTRRRIIKPCRSISKLQAPHTKKKVFPRNRESRQKDTLRDIQQEDCSGSALTILPADNTVLWVIQGTALDMQSLQLLSLTFAGDMGKAALLKKISQLIGSFCESTSNPEKHLSYAKGHSQF